jgi:Ubiquitin-like domain
MHGLITQACRGAPIVGTLVLYGQYSLFRTHDGKNLENDWEGMVVPGLEIRMMMWRNGNIPGIVRICNPPMPGSFPSRCESERRRKPRGQDLEEVRGKAKESKLPSKTRTQKVSRGNKRIPEENPYLRGSRLYGWMAGPAGKGVITSMSKLR